MSTSRIVEGTALPKTVRFFYTKVEYQNKEPTKKQIDYARAIADELQIELPQYDFDSYRRFISVNKGSFNHRARLKRSVDPEWKYLPEYQFRIEFGTELFEWLSSVLEGICGLYAFISNGRVVYIGKSKNLADRIPSSYNERKKYADITKIMYLPIDNYADVCILEIALIIENKPVLNTKSNAGIEATVFKSGIDVLREFQSIPLKGE